MAELSRSHNLRQHGDQAAPFSSVMLVVFVVGVLTFGIAFVSENFLLGGSDTHPSTLSAGPQLPASDDDDSASASSTQSGDDDDAVAEDTAATPEPISPSRLEIPRLDVDAHVQHVGYTDDGRMDEPDEFEDVAWFQYGFFPGAPGNSVIAGHLDSDTGAAVFAGLYLMEPGDEISVTGEDGEELTFVVTDVERVLAEEAPLDRIFGPSDTPKLNLITCEGHFDPDEEDYDHRLIVYTELVTS
jgi:sortase A